MAKPTTPDLRNYIVVKGARENNLQNIDVLIPKNQLVVITGLSGSGKSSLAFDTIYAEGQRRYLESLSSYARQFLGGNEKPDVDAIDGLSPAISIDQKTTSHNPRSTVGTVTEIYDYLRLLYARVGKPHCVYGHGLITSTSLQQILVNLYKEHPLNAKIQILAPVVKLEKGTFKNKFEELKKQGYLRVRVDQTVYSLDDDIALEKNQKHTIEIIIDRIILHDDQETKSRLYDALEKATKAAHGQVVVLVDEQSFFYSQTYACDTCGFALPELEPRFFSFNSPVGACKKCNGLGFSFEPDPLKLLPDHNLTINEGAVAYFKNVVGNPANHNLDYKKQLALYEYYDIPLDVPLNQMSKAMLETILYGSANKIAYEINYHQKSYSYYDFIEGVASLIKRRYYETASLQAREFYGRYMSNILCTACEGKRLAPASLAVKIAGYNIIELTEKNIASLITFFLELKLAENDYQIAKLALKEIINRLSFLENVGLNYLTLARSAMTLSGGESQRIRLATQIGSALTGVLYVLDEPSIGLHQKDNARLIATLQKMRDLGNTLLVVEHDEETMRACDYLIDIGPYAGAKGGQVVVAGDLQTVSAHPDSITGQFLSGKQKIAIPTKRRKGNGKVLEITGAAGHNLKKIHAKFPLGTLIVVTGVSGSGKSTLVNETLVKALQQKFTNPYVIPAPFSKISGWQHVNKIIQVTQEPIGRTPRSNPATYVGVFDDIRDLFANTKAAKTKGYTKGRFSFNIAGGRCETCKGDGLIKIEMHFLPNVYIKCEDCLGKKYNDETLQVLYNQKSIYDVLEMAVDEAYQFFNIIPQIRRKLELMQQVGLGYLKLGASSLHLSGGEAQRIKLAKYLQKKATGKSVYVLDEPTTGLHSYDIMHLIGVLNQIVKGGDTVIVVEHNLDLIKVADYVLDLGPDGGDLGGKLIAFGTPEQIAQKAAVSYTGQYLAKVLAEQS